MHFLFDEVFASCEWPKKRYRLFKKWFPNTPYCHFLNKGHVAHFKSSTFYVLLSHRFSTFTMCRMKFFRQHTLNKLSYQSALKAGNGSRWVLMSSALLSLSSCYWWTSNIILIFLPILCKGCFLLQGYSQLIWCQILLLENIQRIKV